MPEGPRGVHGAWRGGACPQCGDQMPANVVHCRTCRALLNSELSDDSVEIPEFVPLPEIPEIQSLSARGHYVSCPGCREELRINRKYFGAVVQCRFCEQQFSYDSSVRPEAMYADCPHCSEQLRADVKYLGQKVACRFCNGPLHLQD